MLHVATVHWRRDDWITAQLKSLARFAPDAVTWASIDGVDAARAEGFDHVVSLEDLEVSNLPPGDEGREDAFRHGLKLNALAEMITTAADEADELLFLDGDALLIAPLSAAIATPEPLVAVRREENAGDSFPHPSFCLTTVGFWNELGGDWRRGSMWVNERGRAVTDTGGFVLEALEASGTRWRPLRRMNQHDLHPLWFGLYGDDELGPIVYHHGAGFRPRESRIDPPPGRDLFNIRSRAFEGRQQRLDATVRSWIDEDPESWFQGRLI